MVGGVGVEPTGAVIIMSFPIEDASALRAHRHTYNLKNQNTIEQKELPSQAAPMSNGTAVPFERINYKYKYLNN